MVVMQKKQMSLQLIFSPFISQLGSAIYLLGLNWLIVHATGDTKLIGLITGLGGIFFVVGDLVAATLVDHHDRKMVMVGADAISAAACLIGAWLIDPAHPQTWLLILITAVLDLLLSISYPAAKAITPDIIAPTALQRFNAIANSVFSLASIVTPLVGGLLLANQALDFKGFLIINALSFIVAGLLSWSIRAPRFQPANEKSNMLRDTITGLRFVLGEAHLRLMMIALGAFNFCAAGFLLTAPFIADTIFQGRATAYSEFLMMSAIGGMIGGSLLALQRRAVSAVQVYGEQVLYGVLLILLGLWLQHPFWLICALINGFVNGRMFASLATLMQAATPRDMLGRVFGLIFLVYDGVQPLGNFFFGAFIHNWGAHTYLVLGALLVIGFTLLITLTRRLSEVAEK